MPSQVDLIRDFVEAMPATQHLGLRIVELGSGRAVVEMDNVAAVTFDGVTVQGGIVGVIADYAAVAACGSMMPNGWLMATTGSQTHNLAPAVGQRLVAVGEVVKTGKRLAIARADVFNDSTSGAHCLTGLFTATGVSPNPG